MSAGRSVVRAGIDEAGLGPVLGPLTIGYAALRQPDESDPWRALKRCVAQRRVKNPRRLVVADSKKVFDRSERGLLRLESTVLSFLALLDPDGQPPHDAGRLFLSRPGLSPATAPWYASLPQLPLCAQVESLELSAALLRREARAADIELVDAGVRVVPADELNDSYARTDNKSLTVWSKTAEVLRRLWRGFGTEPLVVDVDIQGGRFHYGPLLARSFPDAVVHLEHERAGSAAYRLEGREEPERRMRVAFHVRGEERAFAVALASCLAKYARELVMQAFNHYFLDLQPDLKPTAGYYTDAQRWLAEAGPALRRADLERAQVVRER